MRLVKRTLGICLIVVLTSTLSILTTGVVVNAYIQSVLASFDIKLDSPAPGIGSMMKSMMGMNAKKENKENIPDSLPQSSEEPAQEQVPEDSVPVMGQAAKESASSNKAGGALDQKVVMTPEALSELKDNLPSAEKVNIFNILMSKLPQDEMQRISAAMEDGLTESEVKELQQVIAKYVAPEEYDALMKMLTPGVAAQTQN